MNYNKIRVAATAYYANLSDEERLEAQKFYKSLDTDGNGTISHNEYISFLKKEGYRDTQNLFKMQDKNGDGGTQNLFKMLDKNGDGVLDFEECITLFFMIRVHHNHVSCDGCGASMWDIYFVCAECYEAGGNTYDLCCDCYQKKNFKHQHAVFFDNFKLLRDMQPTATQPTATSSYPNNKKTTATSARQATMEDLVKIARLYYNKCSSDIKRAAQDFFNTLDSDNDGKVSLHEFLGLMRQLGHVKMSSRDFFKKLDKDGRGTLEFMEVMALYYIIKSGRPFCAGCDDFITGIYFSCSKCFENGNNLFCICPNCFEDGAYVHEHITFMDNYALLEAQRMQGIATFSNQHKPSSSVTITELPTSTRNAVVPYKPQQQPKPAQGSFELCLQVGTGATAPTSPPLVPSPRKLWINLPLQNLSYKIDVIAHPIPEVYMGDHQYITNHKLGIAFNVLEIAVNAAAAGSSCTIM